MEISDAPDGAHPFVQPVDRTHEVYILPLVDAHKVQMQVDVSAGNSQHL